MASMILEYTFKDDSFIQIENGTIKFWLSTGLPTYEGTWADFEQVYPEHIAELLKNKIIRLK